MIPSPPSLLRECYQFLVLKLQVMQWTCCRLSRGLDTTCGMQWIPWLHRSAWTSSHSITLPGIVHALQCTEGNCPPFDSTCSLPLVYTCYICTLCTVTHVQVCTCYVHVHVHVEVVWLHVRYMCEWFRRGFSCLLRCEGTQPSKGGPYRLYMFMYVYMSCISGFVGLQHLHLLHALVCVLPPAFYLTENMLSDLHLWYSIFRKATQQKGKVTKKIGIQTHFLLTLLRQLSWLGWIVHTSKADLRYILHVGWSVNMYKYALYVADYPLGICMQTHVIGPCQDVDW